MILRDVLGKARGQNSYLFQLVHCKVGLVCLPVKKWVCPLRKKPTRTAQLTFDDEHMQHTSKAN